jgi:hypothetical protein
MLLNSCKQKVSDVPQRVYPEYREAMNSQELNKNKHKSNPVVSSFTINENSC